MKAGRVNPKRMADTQFSFSNQFWFFASELESKVGTSLNISQYHQISCFCLHFLVLKVRNLLAHAPVSNFKEVLSFGSMPKSRSCYRSSKVSKTVRSELAMKLGMSKIFIRIKFRQEPRKNICELHKFYSDFENHVFKLRHAEALQISVWFECSRFGSPICLIFGWSGCTNKWRNFWRNGFEASCHRWGVRSLERLASVIFQFQFLCYKLEIWIVLSGLASLISFSERSAWNSADTPCASGVALPVTGLTGRVQWSVLKRR